MTKAYVIQIGGRTAGIVARDHADQSFHFFASSQIFNGLEGRSFAEPLQAERAARRVQARQPTRTLSSQNADLSKV